MVGPPPITCSISRWMPSRRTIRCSAVGMMKPLTTSAIAAVTSRCGRILDQRLPGDRQRQRDRLQREHVEHRGDAVLVQQHEAQHQHAAGEEMRDVEGQRCASEAPRHEQQEHGERRRRECAAEEDRIAEHPHLGDAGLADRQQHRQHEDLDQIDDDADRERADAACPPSPCRTARTGRRSARNTAPA